MLEKESPVSLGELDSELSKWEKTKIAAASIALALMSAAGASAVVAAEKADEGDTIAFLFLGISALLASAATASGFRLSRSVNRADEIISRAESEHLIIEGTIIRRISAPDQTLTS